MIMAVEVADTFRFMNNKQHLFLPCGPDVKIILE